MAKVWYYWSCGEGPSVKACWYFDPCSNHRKATLRQSGLLRLGATDTLLRNVVAPSNTLVEPFFDILWPSDRRLWPPSDRNNALTWLDADFLIVQIIMFYHPQLKYFFIPNAILGVDSKFGAITLRPKPKMWWASGFHSSNQERRGLPHYSTAWPGSPLSSASGTLSFSDY